MIALGGHIGLVVEDRRMAGVGDEISQVRARRQVAGEWRGGVEGDDHRPRFELSLMPAATLPMWVSGTARMTTSAPFSASSGETQSRPRPLFSRALPGRRHLDMPNLEARAFEVVGEAVAHFSARAEKCDRCHWLSSRLWFAMTGIMR